MLIIQNIDQIIQIIPTLFVQRFIQKTDSNTDSTSPLLTHPQDIHPQRHRDRSTLLWKSIGEIMGKFWEDVEIHGEILQNFIQDFIYNSGFPHLCSYI